MPWSNQSGGGGGNGGPWGPRPGGSGGQQPDLEEILRKSQDRLRQAMPGGGMGGLLAGVLGLLLVLVIGIFAFTVRVNTDEVGIVLRFGEYVRQLQPGLHFRLPYPIEVVELPKFTRLNRIEIGMRGSSDRGATRAVRDVPEEVRAPEADDAAATLGGLAGIGLDKLEKEAIRQTLGMTGGNREQAARMLGIGERTLYRKLKEYGLK